MATKSAGVDPAAVKGWIADARKKPVSFAILTGKDGLIFEADKVKSPDQMRKSAKSAGGSKGCWGKMEVQQKTLVLTYEGNPPGGFEKQIRKLLSDAGAAMRVEMTALADADEAAEEPPEDDQPAVTDEGDTGEALDEEIDAEDTEDEEEEPSDLPTVLMLARKKPLNFACMLADSGVVLVTHRRKNWGILVKQAKGLGGSAKGAWGTFSVEGKQVVLTCEEDPPGTLARRLKIKLRDEGQKYAVVIRSPAGEAVDADEDEEGEETAAGTAAPGVEDAQDQASSEQDLEDALSAVERLRSAMSDKQSKMFDKLTQTAQSQAASQPSKAGATVKLLLQKLEGLGLEPVEGAAAAPGQDQEALQEQRKSRLSDIEDLGARVDALMAELLEGEP